MYRLPVHQTLRVELHGQQKRQPVASAGVEFQPLDESVGADGNNFQGPRNLCHSLMMCAIHTQCLPACYLGQ